MPKQLKELYLLFASNQQTEVKIFYSVSLSSLKKCFHLKLLIVQSQVNCLTSQLANILHLVYLSYFSGSTNLNLTLVVQ